METESLNATLLSVYQIWDDHILQATVSREACQVLRLDSPQSPTRKSSRDFNVGEIAILFEANAVAQERAKACLADVKKLCADIEPGGGRVAGCFKQHLNELSEPCQNWVAEATAAAKRALPT